MADPADDRIVERYRALGRAEPPAELDAEILAAARRAASSRPGRRRWMLPVSIAAVVVLSVSVALQLQRERPATADRLGAPPVAGKAVAPAAPAPPPALKSAPAAAANVTRAPAAESKREEAPARAAAPAARMLQKSDQASPEAWLARIAKLRREGRDEEADRQLKEFRRRFPDYRIPPAIQREVEPR